ncbi:MAG: selenoprotein B glycine/betaine/sarcosine/D-proline reductase [Alphaproteobacteria bacterium]|nr:selenoprotein B glycine/betaine/sarcosine/D-proline reductase [Alphaproteobacteria bacterium]
MARLADLPESLRQRILTAELPVFPVTVGAGGPPLGKRRVAIITTSGLQRRSDAAFGVGSADYRVIPGDTPVADLVMSHISVNYDRTGFQQDVNVVFPIDRLRELAAASVIGSVADYHYAFMGASDPRTMETHARGLAGLLKADRVDAVILTPV